MCVSQQEMSLIWYLGLFLIILFLFYLFFVIQDSSLSVKLWTPDDDIRLNATVTKTGITIVDAVSVFLFVNKMIFELLLKVFLL